MNELDKPLVRSFADGSTASSAFGHREHLEVAWRYLRVMPLEDALARYVRYLRALTVAAGVPRKFHRTATFPTCLRPQLVRPVVQWPRRLQRFSEPTKRANAEPKR